MVSPFAQHLGTSYVPSDEEVPMIRDAILQGEEALVAIDKRVREIETQLKALQREREALDTSRMIQKRQIGEHLSLISQRCPIQRVNDDILATIFLDRARTDSLCISPKHPAIVISHVCHRWRQTALSTQLLWYDLKIQLPEYPDSTHSLKTWKAKVAVLNELAETWLHRSGDCHIRLEFLKTWLSPKSLFGAVVDCAELQRLMNTVCSSSARWKHLDVPPWSPEEPHDLPTRRLLSVSAESSPVLTSIALGWPKNDWRRDHDACPLLSEQLVSSASIFSAPTLRSLRIDGGIVKHDILQMPVNWYKLEHLHFKGYSLQSSHSLDAVQALTLMRECSNLVTCSLNFQREITVPSDLEPVSLLQLRELSFGVDSYNIPRGFGRSLILPSLRKLHFYDSWVQRGGPLDHHESGLSEFLERFGATLQDVAFNFSFFTQPVFYHSLQHLPNVTSLKLTSGGTVLDGHPAEINRDALTRLTPQFNEAGTLVQMPFCPNLEVLELSVRANMMPEPAMVNFIEARRRTQDDLTLECGRKVARLRKLDCSRHFWRLTLRPELRRRGVDMNGFWLSS